MVKNPDSALGERAEAFGEGAETVRTPVPAEILVQDVPMQVDAESTEASSLPPTPGGPLRPPNSTSLDELLSLGGGVIGSFDDDTRDAVNSGAVVAVLDDEGHTNRIRDEDLKPARRRTLLFVETPPPPSPAFALQTVRFAIPILPSKEASMPTVQVALELSWLGFLEELKRLLDEAAPDGAWTTTVNDSSEGSLVVKVNWQDLCLHALAKTNVWRDGLPRFPEKLRKLVLLIWVDMQHHIGAGAHYLCVRGRLPDHVLCEPTLPAPVEQLEQPSRFNRLVLIAGVALLVTSLASAVLFGLV
ncbi:MAG: hypothetical protein KBC69_03450 [Candidatus Magasanikbacteria bacterium]|nr:hypothetical protein [Candidatus Magasanikbacteria bacterium]